LLETTVIIVVDLLCCLKCITESLHINVPKQLEQAPLLYSEWLSVAAVLR